MSTTIKVIAQSGSIVTINVQATPYKQVTDSQGVLHTFFSKEAYADYTDSLKEQK